MLVLVDLKINPTFKKNPEGGRGKGGRREKEEVLREGRREGGKGGEEDPGLGVGIKHPSKKAFKNTFKTEPI
jgi:hypothetical protein